jgi:hypothetical protein
VPDLGSTWDGSPWVGGTVREEGTGLLHLRVICPPARTRDVRDLVDRSVGVAHLMVLPGAAVRPPGDVLEADLARECVDELLAGLTALWLDHDGAITLENLDTVLSDAAEAAEEAAPGEGVDAVVWDELIARTGEDSRLSVSFQIFLTIACLLAAIGAITDSPVTVVGAMVLGPEFGPLAALAVGLVLRRRDLVRRAGSPWRWDFRWPWWSPRPRRSCSTPPVS